MEEERARMDELITGHLSGVLDKSSLDELEKWIATSPEHKKHFMQMQEIWFSAVSEDNHVYDKDKAFRNFKDRIGAIKTTEKSRNVVYPMNSFLRYVAVFALIALFSALSFWRGSEQVKNSFEQIVVEAPLGSRSKLSLPDGTTVWLNAGSKMSYSQGFGVEERNVQLEGEGYFEVAHNKDVPFYVKTKDLQVRVVGTKFNFRDYPMDAEAMVSLEEGKVVLKSRLPGGDEVMLEPNERIRLNKADGKIIVEKAVASNALQWTLGYLFFDEELLPDIAKELERSYNVKITIADSLKGFRFYGNFTRQEQSIQEVLNALSSTKKIRYQINERDITLY